MALRNHSFPVKAIGLRKGEIGDVVVQTGFPELTGVHTVSLYIGPDHQEPYLDYILSLRPKRLIFNKKTYNKSLMEMAMEAGIEVVEDCTLVMIAKGTYWGD